MICLDQNLSNDRIHACFIRRCMYHNANGGGWCSDRSAKSAFAHITCLTHAPTLISSTHTHPLALQVCTIQQPARLMWAKKTRTPFADETRSVTSTTSPNLAESCVHRNDRYRQTLTPSNASMSTYLTLQPSPSRMTVTLHPPPWPVSRERPDRVLHDLRGSVPSGAQNLGAYRYPGYILNNRQL